jgi:hypothetical protein
MAYLDRRLTRAKGVCHRPANAGDLRGDVGFADQSGEHDLLSTGVLEKGKSWRARRDKRTNSTYSGKSNVDLVSAGSSTDGGRPAQL